MQRPRPTPSKKKPEPAPAPKHEAPWTELIAAMGGRRVLVVGDIILDRYLWGEVERTSPEAPVPVVRLRRQTDTLGGAANVVANLIALGGRAELLGLVGADDAAAIVRERLRELGVEDRHLLTDPARPTIVKSRVICQTQQLLRIDHEVEGPLPPKLAVQLLRRFAQQVRRCDLVIFSDYGKGVLTRETCARMLEEAQRAGRRVVVDPKGSDYSKYRGAAVITPNQKEAQAAAGLQIHDETSLHAAARALHRVVRGDAVAITRGAQGVSVFPRRAGPLHIAAQALAVYDVTGAGDSLVAALSLALAAGASLADAARAGNAAGSIVVGKLGAATASPGELLALLQPGGGGHKLRAAEPLARELSALRAAGRRIVFTNGIFDLLHLGHFKFLQQARRLGDVLVVGLNSDASVRALKGPPRPVLSAQERAAILSSLDAVDFVVIFEDETPRRLLETLRPDVLVKGKSQPADEVVGREIVEAYGGRVELLPLLGDVTTKDLLSRIVKSKA